MTRLAPTAGQDPVTGHTTKIRSDGQLSRSRIHPGDPKATFANSNN
jgi:hypothetical protein